MLVGRVYSLITGKPGQQAGQVITFHPHQEAEKEYRKSDQAVNLTAHPRDALPLAKLPPARVPQPFQTALPTVD